ncbi:hypothetical protein BOTCAL_0597g00040 [Botryotinia calthae]|uniref:Uncharacterized protein n=1 Tax=Botryotinia calthae TaxID=38488 RepID=A0A4Y8CJK6_9HELO|nr:hypothetical protein BOTCAL_0597g00040 [Botryotinia calthae]
MEIAGIDLNYLECRVLSKGGVAAIMLFMLHCERRLGQNGRLTNRHLLASLMGFEDRCINFLLILANTTELPYVNVRTPKFYKALDHCESCTIAHMRRKRAERQDMQNAEHGREEGRWENFMEYKLRTYQMLEQVMRNGPLLLELPGNYSRVVVGPGP